MTDKDLTRAEVVAFMKMRDMQPSHYKMGRHLLRCMDERERLALAISGGEDAPKRIKAWCWNGKDYAGQWHVDGQGITNPYILATPDALSEAPEVQAMIAEAVERAEAAEAENARLREALEFYRNGFERKAKRSRTGLLLSVDYTPTQALLDDCGNRAIAALAGDSHD